MPLSLRLRQHPTCLTNDEVGAGIETIVVPDDITTLAVEVADLTVVQVGVRPRSLVVGVRLPRLGQSRIFVQLNSDQRHCASSIGDVGGHTLEVATEAGQSVVDLPLLRD